jgi:hypothetical protein
MEEIRKSRDSDRRALDPPTFAPPPEMRAEYLRRRREGLEDLLGKAERNDWKALAKTLNHVRGSGAMFGFAGIGVLAEELTKAAQNGEAGCQELLEKYVKAVKEAYV